MAKIVWQQLVANTCQRPSGCCRSLWKCQPKHASRWRNSSVVMRTPIEKRSAEPSVFPKPPRRGTSEQHPADAPFWSAVCGAASLVQESEDSGSRFFEKQQFDAFASIQVVPQSYLNSRTLQVEPTPAGQVSRHWGRRYARFRSRMSAEPALRSRTFSDRRLRSRMSRPSVHDPDADENSLTSIASNGHWAVQIMQPTHMPGTGSGYAISCVIAIASCGQTSAQIPQPVHSWPMSIHCQSIGYPPFVALICCSADPRPQTETASRIGK